MAEFFKENEVNNITITKDNMKNVNEFSRVSPDITLGNLPRYEDLYKKEITPINRQEISEFKQADDANAFADREFKKATDKSKELTKTRVKIFLSVYLLVTLILTGFVIFNLVSTVLLNSQVKSNNIRIKDIGKRIERRVQEESDSLSIQTNLDLPKDLNLII